MRWSLYIVLATLTLTSRFASAQFTGFPLATNDAGRTWLTANDANKPVRQLFEAIQERCLATGVPEIEFVETVKVDGGWATNVVSPYTVHHVTASGFPLLIESGEDVNGEYTGSGAFITSLSHNEQPGTYFINDGWDYEWEIWSINDYSFFGSDEGPASTNWVQSYDGEITPVGGKTTYSVEDYPGGTTVVRNVISVTVTNVIGDFSLDIEGTNYTGVTYVSRDLLDVMWSKVEELSKKFALPGDEWLPNSGGETNAWDSWDAWFGKAESLDFSVPIFSGNIPWYWPTNAWYVQDNAWRVRPYLLPADPAIILNEAAFASVSNLTSNDWGVVTGGDYTTRPVTENDYIGRVRLAEASCAVSNEWTSRYVQSVTNREGVDLVYYIDGATPLPHLEGSGVTNATATITGSVPYMSASNTVVTNLAWNTETGTGAELSNVRVTNVTYTVMYSNNVVEVLSLEEYSAYPWASITNFVVDADITNASVALVWDVKRWEPISYRLYAEELDKMYHILRAMRYSLRLEGRDGQVLDGVLSTNVATYTDQSKYKTSSKSIHPWLAARVAEWPGQLEPAKDLAAYIPPYSSYSLAEFYAGEDMENTYYTIEGGEVVRTAPQPANVLTMPPWYWPQTLTFGKFFPAPLYNTPVDGWDVIVDRTINSYPPDSATAAAWLDTSNDASWGSEATTNKVTLPYALSQRVKYGGRVVNASAPQDDYITGGDPEDDFPWYYFHAGSSDFETNGPPHAPIWQGNNGCWGWSGSAALEIDFTLPEPDKFKSARVYYGDFLTGINANMDVENWTNWSYPTVATVNATNSFWGGDETWAWPRSHQISWYIGRAAAFPPVRWDNNALKHALTNWKFEGNGLLSAPKVVEYRDMSMSGTNTVRLSLTVDYPPISAGDPGTPVWNEFGSGRGMMQKWAGTFVTELFFVIEWDFAYQ